MVMAFSVLLMDVSVPEQYSIALSPYEDSKWTTCGENIWIYRHRLFVQDAIPLFRNCNSIPRPLAALAAVSEENEYSAAGPRDESIVWRFQGNWPPSAIVMIEWISDNNNKMIKGLLLLSSCGMMMCRRKQNHEERVVSRSPSRARN